MRKKFVDYEGGKICYSDEGIGETIVLVHGYLENSDVWNGFHDKLSLDYRVISIDLPGNGQSSLYKQDHTMCFLAGSILAILDIENIKKCVLIGHSLGGYVSLSIVENNPDRLNGYVLFHSHPFTDTDEIIDNRLREIKVVLSGKKDSIYPVNIPKMFADKNLARFKDEVKQLKEIASGHSDDGIVSIIRGMINRKSRLDILEKGEVPLLYILGKLDNYIPYDLILSNVKIPDSGKLLTLDDSGHMGFLEETDRCLFEINKFISKL